MQHNKKKKTIFIDKARKEETKINKMQLIRSPRPIVLTHYIILVCTNSTFVCVQMNRERERECK